MAGSILLRGVAQLVTQYLALVQPFRTFLQHEKPGPGAISDYLWPRGPDPWGADVMTRVVDAGKLILGNHIHVQDWRQITVGIARRKFASAEANLLIENPFISIRNRNAELSAQTPLNYINVKMTRRRILRSVACQTLSTGRLAIPPHWQSWQ
jgi:hypothetical protein